MVHDAFPPFPTPKKKKKEDLALQQLANDHKKGGHVGVVPLVAAEQLEKWKRCVIRFSRSNSKWQSGEKSG